MTPKLTFQDLTPACGSLVEASGGGSLADLPGETLRAEFLERGVLLLRGFEADLDAFRALSDRMGSDFSLYEGGVFRWRALDRQQVGDDPTVMTTTGHSTGFPVAPHGEMYYMGRRPSVMWFYCERPAADGGQTTLHDGVEVARRLTPESRRLLAERDLLFERRLLDGDWQVAFRADAPEEALATCARLGTDAALEEDGSLVVRYTCRGLLERRGAPTCINSILPVWNAEQAVVSGWVRENLGLDIEHPPITVRLADGSPLPEPLVEDLEAAAEGAAIEVDWRSGDAVMVDNTRVMHGRRGTSDPERSILVRMGELRDAS